MTRKLLFGLLGVTLMAALMGTPAMAHHDESKPATTNHQGPPEPPELGILEALCVVEGEVRTNNASLDGGVNATQAAHNHYEFVDTSLECTDVNPSTLASGGTYEVLANGASDSCQLPPPNNATAHGETAAEGCGDGALDPVTCAPNMSLGGLTAERTVPAPPPPVTINGEVDFVRQGLEVVAYGELCSAQLGPGCFVAELVFQPTDAEPTDPQKKVTTADLSGEARVMLDAAPGVCGPGAPGNDS